MTGRVRIPGIVDLVRVDDPAAIRQLASDRRLDRGYKPVGPLFNRLLTSRIVGLLSFHGEPLPTMRARDDKGRAADQEKLAARLDADASLWGEATVEALAACVRGQSPEADIGPLAQQAVGRLFASNYSGTPETWRAAVRLDAAVRSRNPLAWLLEALSGRARKARDRLAAAVAGDAAGIHATGIAVHNIVASLQRMRAAYADRELRQRLTPDAAALRSLVAPAGVLRQATMPAGTAVGSLNQGTLVMYELQAATQRSFDPHLAFLDETWSACPASQIVMSLLRAVWERACSVPEPVS
jgi:hypothetical protein